MIIFLPSFPEIDATPKSGSPNISLQTVCGFFYVSPREQEW